MVTSPTAEMRPSTTRFVWLFFTWIRSPRLPAESATPVALIEIPEAEAWIATASPFSTILGALTWLGAITLLTDMLRVAMEPKAC